MSDRAIYKLKGARSQGRRVHRVQLSSNRVVELEGNIELSENEAERLNKTYVLHKVREVDTPGSSSGSNQSSGENDD
jgi:hypothetical protein